MHSGKTPGIYRVIQIKNPQLEVFLLPASLPPLSPYVGKLGDPCLSIVTDKLLGDRC